MPPTYSSWWKPFEVLGRMGLTRRRLELNGVRLGERDATDAYGGADWRKWASPAALYDLWGSPRASAWSGFHKPTLFASLDSFPPEFLWPRAVRGFGRDAAPERAPSWADERTAIVLDLPGDVSVAYAALLAARTGHEPVVAFNNWPHASGVVEMGSVLGALLFYAPWLHEARANHADGLRKPPVFVLDARRLGRSPKPRDFDNRYFLLETDLPSGPTMSNHGIERLVYVRAEPGPTEAAPREMDDLNGWLHEIGRRVAVHMAYASTVSWGLGEAQRYGVAIRKTPFSTTTDPAFRGFRRNAAGGFGMMVPEPSSGGG